MTILQIPTCCLARCDTPPHSRTAPAPSAGRRKHVLAHTPHARRRPAPARAVLLALVVGASLKPAYNKLRSRKGPSASISNSLKQNQRVVNCSRKQDQSRTRNKHVQSKWDNVSRNHQKLNRQSNKHIAKLKYTHNWTCIDTNGVTHHETNKHIHTHT